MIRTQGLRYQKLDLHIHTPASKDFKNKKITSKEIIQAALDKGLKAIAITDHHSGEAIDDVKAAAKGQDIVVFPGVEIPVIGGETGVHVVAIFDTDRATKDIENFLGAIDIESHQYGKKDVIATDIALVINKIHDRGGLAVLAHANSSKGVIAEIKGASRKTVFSNPNLSAVEVTEADFSQKKVEKGTRAIDLLDGTHEEYSSQKLAVYQASDNPCILANGEFEGHSVAGIGRRYTYFKVDDKITLESLRQCFIDPDIRIRQRHEIEKASPALRFPYIKNLSVTGGFLDGLDVDLHSGLNTVIGGKGSGKSLFIELMRFVLDQESTQPQIKQDHNHKLEKKLLKFGEVSLTYVDETGTERSLTRIYNPIEGNPYSEEINTDLARVFPVLFLSQNEIIRIAESDDEQIKFIDKFFDFRSFQQRIQELEEQIEALDEEFAGCLTAVLDERRLAKQIKSIHQQLEQLNVKLKNPVFERFEKVQKKYLGLDTQVEYLDDLQSLIYKFEIELEELVPVEPDTTISEDPAVKRMKETINSAHKGAIESMAKINKSTSGYQKTAKDELQAFLGTFNKEKETYNAEIQRLGGNYKALNSQREKLIRESKETERKHSLVKARAERISRVKDQRQRLLDALISTHQEYSDKRKEKCQEIEKYSRGRVKVSVLEQSNASEFQSRLAGLKKGSYLKDQEIEAISENIKPGEFILNLLRYHVLLNNREAQLETIAKAVNIDISRVKQLADFLLENYAYTELLDLEHKAIPKDTPVIKVDIGDGQYEPLNEVSTGQKCTAMLVMALSEGAMPIVVDQPEDSLDIRSIWEDMCSKLRIDKENRQFLFTTHNSSLAVASDTDKYIIMAATASRGEIVFCGAIDTEKIKEEVITYLEGGTETYRIKFHKYNIGKKIGI